MLSYEEMRRRYDGEWVLVVDYSWDEDSNHLAQGRVVALGLDRTAVVEADKRLSPKHAAYECFKEPGNGTTLIL